MVIGGGFTTMAESEQERSKAAEKGHEHSAGAETDEQRKDREERERREREKK
jgi:hypothetical protein